MTRRISGDRVGRSFVTPTGNANEVERVLDFQLAADQGIAITSVLGYGSLHDASPAVSDTVPATAIGFQTLHLEEGATEDLPGIAGEDADDLDTEIFWTQYFHTLSHVGSTATFGVGLAMTVTPSGLITFAQEIISPRNIIHKGRTALADSFLNGGVLIYYHFVEFSDQELGVLLARR